MNFLTEPRVRLLSEIALSPVHLAYDHIDDTERYVKALELLNRYDLTDVCSYLLYNAPDFSGKGKPRRADTPEDLYNRVRVNGEFASEANIKRAADGTRRFSAFSFPMKYTPLDAKARDYVGPGWNEKLLDGAREIAGIMHGGFVSSRSAFEDMLGCDYQEFHRNLLMPKEYIRNRISAKMKVADGDPRMVWERGRQRWITQYEALNESELAEFERLIADNVLTAEKLTLFSSARTRALYGHYCFRQNQGGGTQQK